jgi:hypothetical protein
VKVSDDRGGFVARVDFAWLHLGVVGEADGRAKYTGNGDMVTAFDAEKERQARLEALGLVVVRWGARHLLGDPPLMIERLRRALAPVTAPGSSGVLREVTDHEGDELALVGDVHGLIETSGSGA